MGASDPLLLASLAEAPLPPPLPALVSAFCAASRASSEASSASLSASRSCAQASSCPTSHGSMMLAASTTSIEVAAAASAREAETPLRALPLAAAATPLAAPLIAPLTVLPLRAATPLTSTSTTVEVEASLPETACEVGGRRKKEEEEEGVSERKIRVEERTENEKLITKGSGSLAVVVLPVSIGTRACSSLSAPPQLLDISRESADRTP